MPEPEAQRRSQHEQRARACGHALLAKCKEQPGIRPVPDAGKQQRLHDQKHRKRQRPQQERPAHASPIVAGEEQQHGKAQLSGGEGAVAPCGSNGCLTQDRTEQRSTAHRPSARDDKPHRRHRQQHRHIAAEEIEIADGGIKQLFLPRRDARIKVQRIDTQCVEHAQQRDTAGGEADQPGQHAPAQLPRSDGQHRCPAAQQKDKPAAAPLAAPEHRLRKALPGRGEDAREQKKRHGQQNPPCPRVARQALPGCAAAHERG